MNYEDVLDDFGLLIEDDLKSQFELAVKESREYHPFMADVYSTIQEFVLREGRRLASCSTLMVYKGYTGQIDDRIVKACSGVELYRHSILVHDDIVDVEDLRRGGETLHKIFGRNYGEKFGVGTALFAGNMLYAIALRAVLQSGFESEKLMDAIRLFSSEYGAVNESQILDQLFEHKEPILNEWNVMASKRASSLFKASMLTGAILASAPENDKGTLACAAEHIGYAFDIQDDIIDTFASKEQYGREPCGDISKRKKPLHIVLALEKDNRLALLIGKPHTDVEVVQGLIRDCGALDEAKSISRDHAKEAQRLISLTGMSEEAKDFFASFIKYVDESLDWYK
ncbi:MAG: polyprenyl synthetase family protein [Methanotrichaceae archaeon]